MSDSISSALAGGLSSPTIGVLAAALAKTQGKVLNAEKDKLNPAFKSKYADLASIWAVCREPLSANQLALVQMPENADEGYVSLRTVLMHASGEFIQTVVSTRLGKNDAQGIGSALTYLRRYSLSAMIGVAPEDDDGNAASNQERAPARPPAPAPPTSGPIAQTTPAKPPPSAHHESWTATKGQFFADLTATGYAYDAVSAWTDAEGWGRPSSWPAAKRSGLLDALREVDNPRRKRLDSFIFNTNPEAP